MKPRIPVPAVRSLGRARRMPCGLGGQVLNPWTPGLRPDAMLERSTLHGRSIPAANRMPGRWSTNRPQSSGITAWNSIR
jgi:hypothetical protein